LFENYGEKKERWGGEDVHTAQFPASIKTGKDKAGRGEGGEGKGAR